MQHSQLLQVLAGRQKGTQRHARAGKQKVGRGAQQRQDFISQLSLRSDQHRGAPWPGPRQRRSERNITSGHRESGRRTGVARWDRSDCMMEQDLYSDINMGRGGDVLLGTCHASEGGVLGVERQREGVSKRGSYSYEIHKPANSIQIPGYQCGPHPELPTFVSLLISPTSHRRIAPVPCAGSAVVHWT